MLNNDDPIKEYTPFRLGIDNLEDNLETRNEYVDKGFHDCSDDLSDRGSRREEIEHAKFAEKARQANAAYNRIKFDASRPWNKSPVKTKSSNGIAILITIIIIFSIFSEIYTAFMEVFESAFNETFTTSDYSADYDYDSDYNDNNSYSINEGVPVGFIDYETYQKNVGINEKESMVNDNMILEIVNSNDTSFSNVVIQTDFYDASNNIIYTAETFVNMLIGNNVQYFEIRNTPEEYVRVKHTYLDGYNGVNYDFNKFDVWAYEDFTENSYMDEIIVENDLNDTISLAQVVYVCMDSDGRIYFETYDFSNIYSGDTVSQVINTSRIDYLDVVTSGVFLNDMAIY